MIKNILMVLALALALAACTMTPQDESEEAEIATMCGNDGCAYGTSGFAGCSSRGHARRNNDRMAAAGTVT